MLSAFKSIVARNEEFVCPTVSYINPLKIHELVLGSGIFAFCGGRMARIVCDRVNLMIIYYY